MTGDVERDLAAEVAALRSELHALGRAVRPLLAGRGGRRDVAVSDGDRPVPPSRRRRGEAVAPAAEALAARAQAEGVPGLLTRYGYFGAAGRSSVWSTEAQPAADLLDQDSGQVARVLAALGHPQRVRLLRALLQQPASAAELVERLGLGTTGQAYHHLHLLRAADLIEPLGGPPPRGRFGLKPHRVQGFLTILAGVWDLLDPRHSTGVWAEPSDAAPPAAAARQTDDGSPA
jgi:DNA gyrase subunit B